MQISIEENDKVYQDQKVKAQYQQKHIKIWKLVFQKRKKQKRKQQRKDNIMPGYGYGKMNKKTSKKPMKKKVRVVMGNKNTKAKKRKI